LCTEKDFIKRERGNAKFHHIIDDEFFVVRDTSDNEYKKLDDFGR
jgi:hypothetical protein